MQFVMKIHVHPIEIGKDCHVKKQLSMQSLRHTHIDTLLGETVISSAVN